jgi:hypothetical protein
MAQTRSDQEDSGSERKRADTYRLRSHPQGPSALYAEEGLGAPSQSTKGRARPRFPQGKGSLCSRLMAGSLPASWSRLSRRPANSTLRSVGAPRLGTASHSHGAALTERLCGRILDEVPNRRKVLAQQPSVVSLRFADKIAGH